MIHTHTCEECERTFTRRSNNPAAYCSSTCRQRAYRKRVAADRAAVQTPKAIEDKLALIMRLTSEINLADADATDVALGKQAAVLLHTAVRAMELTVKEADAHLALIVSSENVSASGYTNPGRES